MTAMPIPQIAIVGRPNVGKSSLLNMLAKAKVSIVDPTPGVTRDRVAALIDLPGPNEVDPPKLVEVIDTGGFGVYTAEGARFNEVGEDLTELGGEIELQIAEAARTADLILFIIDAQSGITALDQTIAQLIRERVFTKGERDLPVLVIANKTDAESWEPHAFEASSLGFGEPIPVSAMNNFRKRSFLEAVYSRAPDTGGDAVDDSRGDTRIAIVGKRNAGKSTFVNALAGEERVIVSEIAGTTRDAVDVRFEIDGESFIAIDTAGFRKKKSLADQIEWYAAHRALRSIRRADVAILLLDAAADISQVDKHLSKEIRESFKPCIIVVNKWDLVDGRKGKNGKLITTEVYQKYIEREMPGLSRCPIAFTSAVDGSNVREVIAIAADLHVQAQQRVSTGQLNTIMRDILSRRGPSSKLGTRAKVLYTTQVGVAPPTIVLVVNHENLFTSGYRRYMLNRLAERTPFEEVPIRLIIRDRKRARLEDLLSGDHRAQREEYHNAMKAGPPKTPRVVHGLLDDDDNIAPADVGVDDSILE